MTNPEPNLLHAEQPPPPRMHMVPEQTIAAAMHLARKAGACATYASLAAAMGLDGTLPDKPAFIHHPPYHHPGDVA